MFSNTRVLVVDDNIDLTKIICMILASEGLTVKVCNNLEEGLFCLCDWKPQVLLLDVNINGEDAREFCKKIKTEKKEAVKVILMSGDESTLDYKDRYGADDCIAKPFDSSLLIKKIAAYLPQPA
jgi:DNA-binding response OmpR family regulator